MKLDKLPKATPSGSAPAASAPAPAAGNSSGLRSAAVFDVIDPYYCDFKLTSFIGTR